MQYLTVLLTVSASAITANALGINCRGSGLCPRASWNNQASVSVAQGLRNAIYNTKEAGSTTFSNGDHVICVSQSQAITITGEAGAEAEGGSASASVGLSGNIGNGGICVFPQNLKDGVTLTLDQIKPLADSLLEHGCTTCGSVPIDFVDQKSNDPSNGILTFNYVANPDCVGSCISASGQATQGTRRSIADTFGRLSRPLLL